MNKKEKKVTLLVAVVNILYTKDTKIADEVKSLK